MSKNCFIYETLNGVSEMSHKKTDDGLMTLSGVFGVCGVRNNNKRVYETANYSKMVTEMKKRIEEEGGIPGELEHPQMMNITLENISHKITDINIDEDGKVTGTIVLLNTPKGQIAQAIVEGGLPLFISSRATGNVDSKTGTVTLERIATYDLVGSPGFSQAKLHLNENQIVESIDEGMYYIMEEETVQDNENNIENNIDENMNMDELLSKFEALENRIDELETQNKELREALESKQNIDLEKLANSIQNWIVEEFAPTIQDWVVEEFAEEYKEQILEEVNLEETEENIKENIKEWCSNEFANGVQSWIVEEFAPGIQDWITNEYSPEVENWIKESYEPELKTQIEESMTEKIQNSINESKSNNLNAIDETLQLLEGLETTKPTYSSKTLITENADDPKFIQEMPAEARVKWDLASQEVKESITRRAKLYNFTNEGAIERFWQNINFDEIKPANIYEGLQEVENERERSIRQQLRSWKSRRG